MGRVSGKVAIVTGAARGMGEAHARRMIEEGAQVMLTDVLDQEGEAAAKALGPNARYMHHNVSKESEWEAVVAATEAAFGPISVLVNNAGIVLNGPIESHSEADYRKVIDVNQIGVFLGMKTVLPSMKRAGGGSMINVSSIAGFIGIWGAPGYTASKFAVRGMTKSAAIEFAPFNIRVNSVHPGMIRTQMSVAEGEGAAQMEALVNSAPAARRGEPEEVSAVVILLASDETRFSTGAEFVVDGGFICQ